MSPTLTGLRSLLYLCCSTSLCARDEEERPSSVFSGLVVLVLVALHTWGLVLVVRAGPTWTGDWALYQHTEGLNYCRNIPMVAAMLALGINWVSPQILH